MAANPKLKAHQPPPVPARLDTEAEAAWTWYADHFDLTPAESALLAAALEQLSLYRSAMAQVAESGLTTTNPETGNVRASPALAAGHAALRAARVTLKALDLPDPDAAPRPRGSRSRGRR